MGLLYNFSKYNTRLTSHLFYNNICVSGLENIPKNKPVLLAMNHPNSFLDAVIVGAVLNRPTHFLARGDAFKGNVVKFILGSLNMLPVYRLSEGKDKLSKNTETFDACQEIFNRRKVVIIFAEGLSENNWALRSMKKGPARIAIKAWESQTPANELLIVPVGLTYEHFNGAGKNILVNFGKPLSKENFPSLDQEARFVKTFNEIILSHLAELAFIDIDLKEDTEAYKNFRLKFQNKIKSEKSVPQILNYLKSPLKLNGKVNENNFIKQSLIFLPLYKLIAWIAPKLAKQRLFFDSITFGLFMFLWPIYLLILGIILSIIF